MSTHTLIVTADDDLDPTYKIECPGVTFEDCAEWDACGCEYADIDEALEADGGVCPKSGDPHRWFSELGMTTPSGRCYLAHHADLGDAASDLGLAPGRYEVTYEVPDETDLVLHLAEPTP